jgi:hypothetical protein
MTTDSGSGFDKLAAGRDAGDERLADEEEVRHVGEDAGDGAVQEEEYERDAAQDKLNEAF